MSKILLAVLSLVPLCFHVSYLVQAWSSSRLDKFDWIFYLLTVPAALWAVWSGGKPDKWDFRALLLLVPMLFLSLTTSCYRINAIGVAASAGVVWGTV